MPESRRLIGLVGNGAIGSAVVAMLREDAEVSIGGVLRRGAMDDSRVPVVHRAAEFARSIALVVEAAGVGAIRDHGVDILASGRDLAILSTAACVDDKLLGELRDAARKAGRRLVALTGAIGGLDALCGARVAGLSSVRYTGRKPPRAWQGTEASKIVDLDRITAATPFFRGTARESVATYPQNANVAATIALAGVGFDATHVTLIADPGIERNIHALDVEGAVGRFRFEIENVPSASNPRTSALTACSVVSFLRMGTNCVPI